MRRGNFEGEKAPAQDMPSRPEVSVLRVTKQGQTLYSADADWGVLDGVHIRAAIDQLFSRESSPNPNVASDPALQQVCDHWSSVRSCCLSLGLVYWHCN